MKYIIYGERYHKHDPIVDSRTNEVIDDGTPKKIRLGSWDDKKLANSMAENIKSNVPKRSWRIWVEN